jgi:hypothetical protein
MKPPCCAPQGFRNRASSSRILRNGPPVACADGSCRRSPVTRSAVSDRPCAVRRREGRSPSSAQPAAVRDHREPALADRAIFPVALSRYAERIRGLVLGRSPIKAQPPQPRPALDADRLLEHRLRSVPSRRANPGRSVTCIIDTIPRIQAPSERCMDPDRCTPEDAQRLLRPARAPCSRQGRRAARQYAGLSTALPCAPPPPLADQAVLLLREPHAPGGHGAIATWSPIGKSPTG